MLAKQTILRGCLLLPFLTGTVTDGRAAEFDKFVKPLLTQKCMKCHGGGKKVNGEVNLKQTTTADQFLKKPGLINQIV